MLYQASVALLKNALALPNGELRDGSASSASGSSDKETCQTVNYYAVSADKNMQVKSTDRWCTEEVFVRGCQIYVRPRRRKKKKKLKAFIMALSCGSVTRRPTTV